MRSGDDLAAGNAAALGRVVLATFGRKQIEADPDWETEFSAALRKQHPVDELHALYARHRDGESSFDYLMRRVFVRAMVKAAGHSLQIGPGVVFKHPETISLGNGVFIGAMTIIQGRFDGSCRIGNHVWIGPQAYFDARDLEIQDYVGWGPGAKVLGSTHTGEPLDAPVITTNLTIQPVVIGHGADVGMNAGILPGVRIGENAIVGAGSIVTADVAAFSIVAGVPARFLRSRFESGASV